MEIKGPSEDYLKSLICYPQFEKGVYSERVRELQELGVREILSQGPVNFLRWRILGKGHVGLVAAAKRNRSLVALKILRVDADRPSMQREASFLAYANMIGVGPILSASSTHFLVSELIDGMELGRWLEAHPNSNGAEVWVRDLLFQAYKLDVGGLDHGELSRAAKHILVPHSGVPVVVDFESSSFSRRSNNLPSLVQYLFIRRWQKGSVLDWKYSDVQKLISLLRAYRADKSLEQFRRITKPLLLDP